jgi:hypothetical protein
MRDLETFERRMADLFERFWEPSERERSVWGPENWAPAIESKVENGNLIVTNATGFCGHKRKPPIEEATKRFCSQLR